MQFFLCQNIKKNNCERQFANADKKERMKKMMIELTKNISRYVIIADNAVNQQKYITKNYGRKNKWDFTYLLDKAKTFKTEEQAKRFIDEHPTLANTKIIPIKITIERTDTDMDVEQLLTEILNDDYKFFHFIKNNLARKKGVSAKDITTEDVIQETLNIHRKLEKMMDN